MCAALDLGVDRFDLVEVAFEVGSPSRVALGVEF